MAKRVAPRDALGDPAKLQAPVATSRFTAATS